MVPRLGDRAARRLQVLSVVVLGASLFVLVAFAVGMVVGGLASGGSSAPGSPGPGERGVTTGIWLLLEHGAIVTAALLIAPVALGGLAWALWSGSDTARPFEGPS